MNDDILKLFLNFVAILISVGGYYSLRRGNRIFDLLPIVGDPLTDAEEQRLDRLLETGKKYHYLAFAVSGLLIALSSLQSFLQFLAPFGGLAFPKIQTAVLLFALVVILLIATDRMFLMAYPWLLFDKRRPPYDWVIFGLRINRTYNIGLWLYVPLAISSIAMSVILGTIQVKGWEGLTFTVFLLVGVGLTFLPKTIYYWHYLISEKLDHRGGLATYSIYLLYWYRLIRQVIYSLFIALPVIEIIPAWNNYQMDTLYKEALIVFFVLYILRMIAGIKKVYKWIDKRGLKYGFPATSNHYK